MFEVHAFILTYNEEAHIGRAIESLSGQVASVTIIDSGSTDRTIDIARAHGANVLTNSWVNHFTQVNFAIDALVGKGGWLLRMDADEVLEQDSGESIAAAIASCTAGCDGLLVQRRIIFLGKRISFGGIEPSWQLRLWRNGAGRCESRMMDEHVWVKGGVSKSSLTICDINLNSISWWTTKHNGYSSLEAIELLNAKYGLIQQNKTSSAQLRGQAALRRFVKHHVYVRLNPGFRGLCYFLYRYILRLGFLDGAAGFYFHFLQGFWYRVLVDAKIAEIERAVQARGVTVREAIKDRTGIDLS